MSLWGKEGCCLGDKAGRQSFCPLKAHSFSQSTSKVRKHCAYSGKGAAKGKGRVWELDRARQTLQRCKMDSGSLVDRAGGVCRDTWLNDWSDGKDVAPGSVS